MTDFTGQDIGRYRIIEALGQGGMATVYRAYDTHLECEVAVKFIRMDQVTPAEVEKTLKRFEREAKEIARLTHPNIVKVTDYGEYKGSPFLVMEYLPGGTLKNFAGKAMPYEQAAKLLAPIARALEAAHQKNLIHRDIKPANILLTEGGQPMLSDFGIAKILGLESGNTLTSTNMAIGTPEYMAPEQWFNQISAKSDIYSLGVLFYELITGKKPYTADTPAGIFLKQSTEPLPRLPGLPDEVEKVLFEALAKNPEDRYDNMGEFAAALENLITPSKPVLPRPDRGRLPPEIRKAEAPPPASLPNLPEEVDVFKTTDTPRESLAPVQPLPTAARPARVQPMPVNEAPAKAGRAVNIPSKPLPAPQPAKIKKGGGSKWWLIGLLALLGIMGVIGLAVVLIYPYLTRVPAAAQATATSRVVLASPVLSTPTSFLDVMSTKISQSTAQAANVRLKVGLVADTGGVTDKAFNQSAWEGIKKAGQDYNLDVNFIESIQSTQYEQAIDTFAAQNYDVIVTVGFQMSDVTAAKAKQYPKIKFASIDNQYFPTQDSAACPATVKDCYSDGGLSNVTSLMFQEDQAGFLAGVLAGGMTKTGTVCTISGMEIPPVVRYVTGFQNGAKWIKPGVSALNVYLPTFTDSGLGKTNAVKMFGQGCDVVFGVGGITGNGALLAAKEANRMAIGVDVDQFNTFPEVQSALLSSAVKNVDVAVYNYLKSVRDNTVTAGPIFSTVENGGVGLAAFHYWDSKIPADVKAKLQAATAGLKDGSISTAASQDPLKIAILEPLTGSLSSFGVSSREGALLAIKQWNAKGGVLGKQVQAIVADSQCSSDQAVIAANKVIDQDKVHYIMGDACSEASIPISEIANAKHVVQVSNYSAHPNVTRDASGNVKPYTFTINFIEQPEGKTMAKFAFETLKARKAFILTDPTNEYSKSLATYFKQSFIAEGGSIVDTETYAGSATDFSSILAIVALMKPDIVVLPDFFNVVNLIAKQAKQKGITTPFIGGIGWDAPDLDTAAADGGYFTTYYSPTDPSPSVQNFIKAYGAAYKDDQGKPKLPDTLAVLAYDATNLLLQGIQDTGGDDPVKVKDTLAKGKFEAVIGPITFDAFHTPIKPEVVMQVKNGKMEFYAEVMP